MRCTLIANGISGDISREDAVTAAEFLSATGRAVNPRKWVDHFIDEDESNAMEAIF